MKLVLTTFANAEDAAKVIHLLVEEKLAACGTIVPGVRSIYHWQGRVEDTAEVAVTLKTRDEKAEALQIRLAQLHPYETPEVVTLAPEKVSTAYEEWVKTSCK